MGRDVGYSWRATVRAMVRSVNRCRESVGIRSTAVLPRGRSAASTGTWHTSRCKCTVHRHTTSMPVSIGVARDRNGRPSSISTVVHSIDDSLFVERKIG